MMVDGSDDKVVAGGEETPVGKKGLSKKGKWLVFGALVLMALGIWGRSYVIRILSPPYVVTAGEALYRPNDAGPVLKVKVQCNRWRVIADSVMLVDSITDDRGRDLMGGPIDSLRDTFKLELMPFASEYAGSLGNWTEVSGSSSDWGVPVRADWFSWQVWCLRPPSHGAETVRLRGRIDLVEGGERQEHVVRDVELKKGVKFQVAGCGMEVVGFSPARGGSSAATGTCTVRIADSGVIVESIRARPEKGGPAEWDHMGRERYLEMRTGDFEGTEVSFGTTGGAERVELTVAFWRNAVARSLPVDLEFVIREAEERVGMFGPGMPALRMPDDGDWGEPMSGDDAAGARIVPGKFDPWSESPWATCEIPIRLEWTGDAVLVAAHLRMDELKDGAGRDLLRPVPLRSDEYRSVCLDSASGYRFPEWSVKVTPRPELPVKGAGVCRMAFGEDEAIEVVPGHIDSRKSDGGSLLFAAPPNRAENGAPLPEPSCGSEIRVGPVVLKPRMVMEDAIAFKAVGNLGLVRKIEALDGNGRVLVARELPVQAFDCKESMYYLDGIGDPGKIRSWRITYFRSSRWAGKHFEFTVEE